MSAIDTHDAGRLLTTLPRGYSVKCDCVAATGITPDTCEGLRVFNPSGRQIGTYKGKRYSAWEGHDGSILIYSQASVRTSSIERETHA